MGQKRGSRPRLVFSIFFFLFCFYFSFFSRYSNSKLSSTFKPNLCPNMSGTIIRGTLKTPNSQLVTPISIKLQRPDGHD
jgi:hypothetical protein